MTSQYYSFGKACSFCSRTDSSQWKLSDGKLDCGLCIKSKPPSNYLFHWNSNEVNKQAPSCFNCKSESSPLWRKTPAGFPNAGTTLCNACGLYLKTHSRQRPVDWKSKISKKRKQRGFHSLELPRSEVAELNKSPQSAPATEPKSFSINSMLNPVIERKSKSLTLEPKPRFHRRGFSFDTRSEPVSKRHPLSRDSMSRDQVANQLLEFRMAGPPRIPSLEHLIQALHH